MANATLLDSYITYNTDTLVHSIFLLGDWHGGCRLGVDLKLVFFALEQN